MKLRVLTKKLHLYFVMFTVCTTCTKIPYNHVCVHSNEINLFNNNGETVGTIKRRKHLKLLLLHNLVLKQFYESFVFIFCI